jgi:hypothetical protein
VDAGRKLNELADVKIRVQDLAGEGILEVGPAEGDGPVED